MKRKFLAFVSLILAVACCFLATGCSQITSLTFKNNFVGGVEHSAVPASYKEILTYKINYIDKYDADYIKKDSTITDSIVAYEYSDGVFVQEFEILDRLPSSVLTDIEVGTNKIYHIKSNFSITVKYLLNGASEENAIIVHDTVESEAYFLPAGLSFAPIYSKTQSDNHFLQLNSEMQSSLKHIATTSETTYKQTKYTMITDVEYFVEDGDNDTTHSEIDYEYKYKTIVDNAQLFFAIRNLTVDGTTATHLPAVSYSYGSQMELYVRNHNQLKENFNIAYTQNGTTYNETGEVKYNHLSFMIGSTTNSGAPQYLKVQTEASANLPYKSLILEYAETLTTFGLFRSLGALVYTLDSVEIFQ